VHIMCHHLNTDGVSWRIVGEDMAELYKFLLHHRDQMYSISAEKVLGSKGTSCRQWVNALNKYLLQADDEKSYWQAIKQATLESNRQFVTYDEKKMRQKNLGDELTSRLMEASHHGLETRIDDILLTALDTALDKVFDVKNCCIMMESHGRNKIADGIDVSRTMGWFANPYPVQLPKTDEDLQITLKNVKKTLREIPNGGTGACMLFSDDEKIERYIPKVYFNYQGEFEQKLEEYNSVTAIDFLPVYDMEIYGHISNNNFILTVSARYSEEKIGDFMRILSWLLMMFRFYFRVLCKKAYLTRFLFLFDFF